MNPTDPSLYILGSGVLGLAIGVLGHSIYRGFLNHRIRKAAYAAALQDIRLRYILQPRPKHRI